LPKNCVENFFKKIDKKIQNRFFLDFFYHVFGRFSVRGVQKHDKKSRKKSDQPWYVFGLRGTNQPPQGPSLFFLSAPCERPWVAGWKRGAGFYFNCKERRRRSDAAAAAGPLPLQFLVPPLELPLPAASATTSSCRYQCSPTGSILVALSPESDLLTCLCRQSTTSNQSQDQNNQQVTSASAGN
jgi:hypothetical protein